MKKTINLYICLLLFFISMGAYAQYNEGNPCNCGYPGGNGAENVITNPYLLQAYQLQAIVNANNAAAAAQAAAQAAAYSASEAAAQAAANQAANNANAANIAALNAAAAAAALAQQQYQAQQNQGTGTGGTTVTVPGTGTTNTSTPPVVTYDAIPRVVTPGPINTTPGSPFLLAISYNNQTTVTLPQAFSVIREYIDKVIPDLPGGREKFITDLVAKVAAGLPEDQKENAEAILAIYMQINDPAITTDEMIKIYKDPAPDISYPTVNPSVTIPVTPLDLGAIFGSGPDQIFNTSGKIITGPNHPNTNTNSVKIFKNGQYYTPSQLDSSVGSRYAVLKIAAYYGAKMGIDPGTIITTKKDDVDSDISPASAGHKIFLNINGGFGKGLDIKSNFISILIHENFHKEDHEDPTYTESLDKHVDVYLRQIRHSTFSMTTPQFKQEMVASLANYLMNMNRDTPQGNFGIVLINSIIDNFNKGVNYGYKIDYVRPEYGMLYQGKDLQLNVYKPGDPNAYPVPFTTQKI